MLHEPVETNNVTYVLFICLQRIYVCILYSIVKMEAISEAKMFFQDNIHATQGMQFWNILIAYWVPDLLCAWLRSHK